MEISAELSQHLINGLVLGSIYALVALGYTMVYGILELINFAHGEITMMGAMVALAVINALVGEGGVVPGPIIVLVGLGVAVVTCMALGFAIERVAQAGTDARIGGPQAGRNAHVSPLPAT